MKHTILCPAEYMQPLDKPGSFGRGLVFALPIAVLLWGLLL